MTRENSKEMPTTVTDRLSGSHTYVPPPHLALTTKHDTTTKVLLTRPCSAARTAPRVEGSRWSPLHEGRHHWGLPASDRIVLAA